ncbi:hypothetical protein ACA910_007697 [Epithemia clementina (nom. ined.)]
MTILAALTGVTAVAEPDGHSPDAISTNTMVRWYPRRTVQEAAVLEWGHSAIITALDASVALFGPQTSDAALLEVETAPVLAVPLDGLRASSKRQYQEFLKSVHALEQRAKQERRQLKKKTIKDDNQQQPPQEQADEANETGSTSVVTTTSVQDEPIPVFDVPVGPLDNAEEIIGNLCIMTTHPGVSGVELALMAQASGAAALLVVNIDDPTRPDDIYRLPPTKSKVIYEEPFPKDNANANNQYDYLKQDDDDDDDEAYYVLTEEWDPRAAQVDIPVVMISLNSAQLLATALLDPSLPNAAELARRAGFSAQYMPERVRLYAGDDRPFFEDVEAAKPTIYLIHDLLKRHECEALIQQAERAGLRRVDRRSGSSGQDDEDDPDSISPPDILQYTPNPSNFVNVDRVTLWQGLLMSNAAKQVEDRLEQVTSFPSAHFSDFVIDRLATDGTSFIHPQYDVFGGGDYNNNNNNNNNNNHHKGTPVASMTIFLSDLKDLGPAASGGEVFFPNVLGAEYYDAQQEQLEKGGDYLSSVLPSPPIKIESRQGMAVIHHSTDEHGLLDPTALHALLPILVPVHHNNTEQNEPSSPTPPLRYFYVARKYIFMDPRSTAHRVVLPVLALPGRGSLPQWVVQVHAWLIQLLGHEHGNLVFDKACVFLPVLMALWIVQFIALRLWAHWKNTNNNNNNMNSANNAAAPPPPPTSTSGDGNHNSKAKASAESAHATSSANKNNRIKKKKASKQE